MDGLEHEAPDESAKPPIHGRPGREVLRKHPPTAARARQIPDRVQDFAQIGLNRPPLLGGARQERLNLRPLLVGQIRRVALGLLLNLGHPATRRWGPHPKLESPQARPFNGFSNSLLQMTGST